MAHTVVCCHAQRSNTLSEIRLHLQESNGHVACSAGRALCIMSAVRRTDCPNSCAASLAAHLAPYINMLYLKPQTSFITCEIVSAASGRKLIPHPVMDHLYR
jgi:hypothetical protein